MPKFLLSGPGRCGSMFASRELNKSKAWIVKHEPGSFKHRDLWETSRHIKRMVEMQNHHGEINAFTGCCLPALATIDDLSIGVIVRNAMQVCASILGRCDEKHHFERISAVGMHVHSVRQALHMSKDVFLIDFTNMVTDAKYLDMIAMRLGIFDIPIDQYSMKKRNKGEPVNLQKQPKRIQHQVNVVGDAYQRLISDFMGRFI